MPDPVGGRAGGCLCGAVRFQAEGEPKWAAFCHCYSCRRHSGAPVTAYAGYPRDKVGWLSLRPAIFASSPTVRRGFCGVCGATLTYECDSLPDEIHLHLGAFDEPSGIVPTSHVFPEERIAWLHARAEGEAGL